MERSFKKEFYSACKYDSSESQVERKLEKFMKEESILIELLNLEDHKSVTSLMHLCRRGFDSILSKILPLNGFKKYVNKVNNEGKTAFYFACTWGRTEVVKVLLKQPGVDINLAAHQSPLQAAFEYKHCGVIFSLLARPDIDVNQQTSGGNTALIHASAKNETESRDLKNLKKAISILFAKGANINAQNEEGDTALHKAVLAGNMGIISLLLENGANPTIENVSGDTALHRACSKGKYEIALKILNYFERNVNGKNKDKLEKAKDFIRLTKIEVSEYETRKEVLLTVLDSQKVNEIKDKKMKDILGDYETKKKLVINTFDAIVVKKDEVIKETEEIVAKLQLEILKMRTTPEIPECPVCMEMMVAPRKIFSCSLGHSVCSVCRPQLVNCPECRNGFAFRNVSLERIIANIQQK